MECPEAQSFVSVVYDGEPVAEEAAEHISGCGSCRQQLHEYAAMGAELRLAGSRRADRLPVPAWLASAAPRRRFLAARALTARVNVPWLAVGLCAAVILALSIGINLVRAQSPALWFQFQLYPADMARSEPSPPRVAKSGYRESMAWFWNTQNTGASGFVNKVGSIVSVVDVQSGRVRLAVRARHYQEHPMPRLLERDLGNLKGHEYTYVPGQTLQIPIEGGGTLLLRGEVSEHQPTLAWGYPLEPGANQMILSHFMLVRDQQVLAPLSGMSTMIGERENRIYLYVPRHGLFTFALQPFAGAVRGTASWSEANFTIDDHHFYLLSGSPITGGDQPHNIWVSLQGDYLPSKKYADHVFLFCRDLSSAPN
jgi:hypothetical protein